MKGAGAKRGRDGAASAAAATAAEVSGDDRFSLSKFEIRDKFKGRTRAAQAKGDVDVEEENEQQQQQQQQTKKQQKRKQKQVEEEQVEEEQVEEEQVEERQFEDDSDDDAAAASHCDDGDGDDDDGDGNYDIDEDDDVHGAEMENADGSGAELNAKSKKIAKKLKPMSPEELAAFMKEQERRGVVYLSRIPPYMKPTKVRHLLQKFGEIGRIYLTPEDPAVTKRRRKMGGNKRVKYEDGWVEFMDKKKARQVAAMLNGQPMGSKNRGFFEHDLWNIKYLSKFKWRHLTEKLAYDREVQRQREQAELMQGKKERDAYVAAVHKARASDAIRKRKAKKSGVESTISESQLQKDRLSAQFRQRATTPANGAGGGVSQSILSRVFQS